MAYHFRTHATRSGCDTYRATKKDAAQSSSGQCAAPPTDAFSSHSSKDVGAETARYTSGSNGHRKQHDDQLQPRWLLQNPQRCRALPTSAHPARTAAEDDLRKGVDHGVPNRRATAIWTAPIQSLSIMRLHNRPGQPDRDFVQRAATDSRIHKTARKPALSCMPRRVTICCQPLAHARGLVSCFRAAEAREW
jgi:hypothetical protein